MSITDELREWASTEVPYRYGHQLTAIADRIDAKHERQVADAFETRNSDENLESDGWGRLPVDADGMPIQPDDVLVKLLDGKQTDTVVRCDGVNKDGFIFHQDQDDDSTEGPMKFICVRASAFVHYHKPTVEDVLRQVIACANNGTRVHGALDTEQIVAEYAAKLRLKEDSDGRD